MKKTYRLIIDYMVEINEKVQADGEYSREIIERTQHIMNAFFLVPEVLNEFIKERIHYCFFNTDAYNNELVECMRIKKDTGYMHVLSQHLPSGTVPYFQALFCHAKDCTTPYDDLDDGFDLVVDQFPRPTPVHASFKEIKHANGFSHEERVNFPGLEECKLVQSIIEFLQQRVKCA
jgi:hypothetical protein